VYRGTWRGTEVAIKRFLEQNLSPVTIREFRDEVMIMSKLRHPNIVLFMGAVTQSNQLAIVTQFVARGSLFRLLHRTKEVLDARRRLNMAMDIAKGE
jgi:serine/threonine protein kinase